MEEGGSIETGDIAGQNVNVGGTQNFHGPVYFGSHRIEAAPTQKTRTFLSYARDDDPGDHHDADTSFMRRLFNDLSSDYDLWWDREHMPSRELSFSREIQDAIADCRCLILVVGEHALTSDYVRSEWEYALSRCIPVIPILRQGTFESIPAQVSRLHAPDFRDDNHYDSALVELKRILGEPDAPLGTLYGVPTLPDNYIEREVLDAVRSNLLADSDQPLVVTSAKQQTVSVDGVGGIGKTTLAIALARNCEVRRAFPDGLFFIEIGKAPDILQCLADIGGMFDDAPNEYTNLTRAKQRLSARLANKRALLILDDVWDYANVQDFQVVDSGCRLLITTRQGGIVTQLNAQRNHITTLSQEEGLRLIAKRLEMQPEQLPEECKTIIQLVDGHTLAVSLVAAQLDERGIEYVPRLLKRLQQGRYFDQTLNLAETDKNLNLELCLRLSYDDLGEDAEQTQAMQTRFRALGILAPDSSFDEHIAQAIWQDANVDDSDDALTQLVRRGLLRREAGQQYSQHGLLRAYAAALLDDAGDSEAILRLYAQNMTNVAQQFDKLPVEEWVKLDTVIAHIHRVGDELAQRVLADDTYADWLDLASQFSWVTLRYLQLRPAALFVTEDNQRLPKRLEWLQMGLKQWRIQDNIERQAIVLLGLGYMYSALGEKHDAISHYEQALTLKRAVGDQTGEANTLTNMGKVWADLGETDKALNHFEQA
ncbi:MAG: TIR domain-containing protein, partial [Anaerolineae bacterium]|nr:TIR domain-containing protein [Anaerolineae bacterium]